MGGEGGSVDDRTVPEVIEGLRALLEAIDAGRIEANAVQCVSGGRGGHPQRYLKTFTLRHLD